MARILIVSDSPAIQSGQGRVVRELAQRFHDDGQQVTVAGWFDLAAPAEMAFDYSVIPAAKERPESLRPILAEIQPEIVLAFGDPWDFAWLSRHRAEQGGFRLVGYLNIEAGPLPLACEQVLDGFDVLATTSAFGAGVLNRPAVPTVHLGVDRRVFQGTPRRSRMLFGRDVSQTFVVLLNAQNIYRKNLRTALAGFARFAPGKPDVVCYANTKPQPTVNDADGPDLYEEVVHLGLESLLWFNPDNKGPLDTVPDAKLNGIYGLSTVLLVTSIAEGFGLPVLEAAAAGVVPIAPDDYSMPELVRPAGGWLMPVAAHMVNTRGMTVSMVSDEAVADALEQAYREWKTDRPAFEARIETGRAFAATKSWEATYRGVREVLDLTRPPRVARGGPINPYLRIRGRRAAAEHPHTFGVLKLGGLGDMLQTTAVIRAASAQYRQQAVVFCNGHPEVFEPMPEVAEVIKVDPAPQQLLVESLADAFPRFLDVRYVSRAYGEPSSDYFVRHRAFYEAWTASSARLSSLRKHATAVMLDSLGLAGTVQPIYTPRTPAADLLVDPQPYLAVATGVGVMGQLKRWPARRWAELAVQLDSTLVQVGGPEDEAVPGARDARGRSLPETAWILEHATLLIGVEGGMVHLAAATGTPAVVLFGPTPIPSFLYLGHEAVGTTGCPPCFAHDPLWAEGRCALGHAVCENLPSVDAVLAQVQRSLGSLRHLVVGV